MRSFEKLVTTDAPASTEVLSKARVVLVQAVNSYILHFSSCLNGAATDTRLTRWKEAHKRVSDIRLSYSEHITRFSASAIKADWPSYKANCHRLLAAMRAHLEEVTAWEPID